MSRQNGEAGTPGEPGNGRRSDEFLAGLEDAAAVVFVSHVQPDPDSLGSMLGLAHLVSAQLGKTTRLTRDGLISRAENRALVELLNIDLLPIDDYEWTPGEKVVMVDSQPNTGRHSFDPTIPIYAVIDHHDTPGELDDVPFVDVRTGLGATCSMVAGYLMEQDLPIPLRVATALFYGIETELSGYPRNASALDDSALLSLYPLADKDLVSQVRNARLPQRYFECLLQSLQNSFIYDRLIISWANELPQPELAAEVVDYLIRFEEIDWAVCAGIFEDQMILSLRSTVKGGRAGEILRQVVGKMGRAGGHDRRAGGCMRLNSAAPSAIDDLQAELRRRLLKALHIDECRGQRLVPLREMLQNLQS